MTIMKCCMTSDRSSILRSAVFFTHILCNYSTTLIILYMYIKPQIRVRNQKVFFSFCSHTYVVGTQKNRLKMVFLSIPKHMIELTSKFALAGHMLSVYKPDSVQIGEYPQSFDYSDFRMFYLHKLQILGHNMCIIK